MNMSDLKELRFLGPGFNWMKIQGMIAVGVGGYDSPLAPGTRVLVETFDPGAACMEGPILVANGTVHTAMTTPPWFGRMALEGHPARWVIEKIFRAYGSSLKEIESWGGKVVSEDRQKGRVEALKADLIDAVFDEALMTHRWKAVTDAFKLSFLSVDDEALGRCEEEGMKRGFIPKGRLKGVDQDTPTVDFAGWLLYCREDFPDDCAYQIVKAIDELKTAIEALFQPGQGLTGAIDPKDLWRDIDIPLHPGAECYYREKGYR